MDHRFARMHGSFDSLQGKMAARFTASDEKLEEFRQELERRSH
jgi:hypothetical protein